jgi:hypothetical protein
LGNQASKLEQRLTILETRLQFTRAMCLLQVVVLMAFAAIALLTGQSRADNSSQVLHIRGLVVEDAHGRPRVLLGSPFPKVPGRKRQDEDSTALVFLNEDGADRLIVGEAISPQVSGKVEHREAGLGSSYGVFIHDGQGDERGGFGFFANSAGGGGRGVIALDRPTGDAWAAMVDDKTGFAGTIFEYPMPAGQYQPGIEMGFQGETPFLHFRDKNDKDRALLELAPNGAPSLNLFDVRGGKVTDIFRVSGEK